MKELLDKIMTIDGSIRIIIPSKLHYDNDSRFSTSEKYKITFGTIETSKCEELITELVNYEISFNVFTLYSMEYDILVSYDESGMYFKENNERYHFHDFELNDYSKARILAAQLLNET